MTVRMDMSHIFYFFFPSLRAKMRFVPPPPTHTHFLDWGGGDRPCPRPHFGASGSFKRQSTERGKKKGIVYRITCSDCSKRYVGETGRTLNDRLKGAQKSPQINNPSHSAVSEHALNSLVGMMPLLMTLKATTGQKGVKESRFIWIKRINPTLNSV